MSKYDNLIYNDDEFMGSKTVTDDLKNKIEAMANAFVSEEKPVEPERKDISVIGDSYVVSYVDGGGGIHRTTSETTIASNPYTVGNTSSVVYPTAPPYYPDTTPGMQSPWLPSTTPIFPKPLTPAPEKKDSNPKDAVGIKKMAMSTIPATVLAEVSVGMLEGARKYRRHNYRAAGVRASVYYDATMRHLFRWWEGEDIDPDSGLSHVTKAITSLVVLRDAMINNKFNDDRPPRIPEGFWNEIAERVNEVFERYPEGLEPYVEGDQH